MILERVISIIVIGSWLLLFAFIIRMMIFWTITENLGAAFAKLFRGRTIYLLLLIAVAISLLNSSLVFVEPEKVGVVISLTSSNGYRPRPLRSGLHWIVPLAEEVHTYPIGWQTYTMSAKPNEGAKTGDDSIAARTSDGQQVTIDCTIIFQVNPEEAPRIYVEWQDRYLADLIRPTIRGLVRSFVSQYKVDEVNSSKRMDLENDLTNELKTTLGERGFTMDAFLLRNISFSTDYSVAVEQKQVALQDAIRKQYEADQIQKLAQGEAARVRTMAQAEADALDLLGKALANNPDVITLRYIDKLSPNVQVMMLPANSPFIFSLPSLTSPTPGATVLPEPSATPALVPTVESTPTPTATPVSVPE